MTSSKDYLSQEEIDALLRQTSEGTTESYDDAPTGLDNMLTTLEQDALGEIGNITFGSAATALSTLLGKKVDITTPKVSTIRKEDLQGEFPKPHVAVHVNYVDGFHGINLLVIQTRDAQVIADLMMGGDGHPTDAELNEIHISAVQEAMNQMMGSSATSMSTIFNRFVNISPPGIDILNFAQAESKDSLPPEDIFIKISFRLTIGELIDSNIMQLLPVSFAKEMVSTLIGGSSMMDEPAYTAEASSVAYETPAPPVQSTPPSMPPAPMQAPYSEPYIQQPAALDPMYQQQMMQQPMYQQPPMQQVPHTPATYGPVHSRNVNVQPVQFSNFSPGGAVQADDTNLNLLLDIPLKVTVELGRTKKVIKDILELSQGSIIELDKLAGEPVDILVNNKLIAKGEVVVIDENFGVRVTDIINQWDRIQKLQ